VRTQTRRHAVLGGAIALVLAAGFGAASIVGDDAGGAPSDSLVAAQPADLPLPVVTPTATPIPSATPTATKPAPTSPAPAPTTAAPTTAAPRASTSATARPSVTTTSAAPTASRDPERAEDDGSGYGASPGAVTFPYDATRRAWSLTRNGTTLNVTIADPTPKAGDPVEVAVQATRSDRDCCLLDVLYGDGLRDGINSSGDCRSPAATSRMANDHTWNAPGRQLLQINAQRGPCAFGAGEVTLRLWVDVQPGHSSSNGPRLPKVELDITAYPKPSDPGRLTFYGMATDDDGHLVRWVLDHGDGTSQTLIPNMGPCQQAKGGTSASSTAFFPNDPPPSHRFAKPGTYTITLRAYSTGCDGRNQQVGSDTYEFTWGAE
jgi:hypothetical protein